MDDKQNKKRKAGKPPKKKDNLPRSSDLLRKGNGRGHHWLMIAGLAVCIAALGFLVYGNSLGGKFIWDDDNLVVNNANIKAWSHIGDIFTGNIGKGAQGYYTAYRPLQILTYMIDYSFWKLDPFGYHLTNLFLHITASLCVFWFVTILFGNPFLSFLTGIFFVVHPVHTEAVSYISGRADPMALIFTLLSFIFYLKYAAAAQGKKLFLPLMIVSYAAALLSRESSLILPVLLLMHHFIFKEPLRIRKIAPFFILAGLYILMRVTLFRSFLLDESDKSHLLERLPGAFAAIAGYARLLVFPFGLHMEYGSPVFSWADPKVASGIILFLSLYFFAWRQRDRNILAAYSFVWFFVAFLPASNIFPVNAYMAEHWLYMPSIGFFLIVSQTANFLYETKRQKTLVLCCVLGLIALASFLTIKQNTYWREPLAFFERTLAYSPESPRVYNNLGFLYEKMGKTQDAEAAFKKAIELDPNYKDALNNLMAVYQHAGKSQDVLELEKNVIGGASDKSQAYGKLGIVYQNRGEPQKAEEFYKKALGVNPNYAEAHNNLGSLYKKLGRLSEAIDCFKKATSINPGYADAYFNLGFANLRMGNFGEAEAAYKKALKLKPDNPDAYNNLGAVYQNTGRLVEAAAAYVQATKLNPAYADTYNNLGQVYQQMGKMDQAVASFKKAIAIDPQRADSYNLLAVVYGAIGKKEDCLSLLKKAADVDPAYAATYQNLAAVYYADKQYELAINYCDKGLARGAKFDPSFLKALEPFRSRGRD